MLKTLTILGIVYIGILVLLAIRSKTTQKTSTQYLLGGANLGAVLGFFTFAATLFSTFTLLGMPDFFRVHGIGAWMFLMFSDAIMVFGLVWIGYAFRKKARSETYYGMSGFLERHYQSRFAGVVAFLGMFIFLIPYVAIQIRGVAIFLHASFPDALPMWVWAVGLVVVMLIYSEVGGLKAIMYSDVLQGILLLIAIWIVGANCVGHFGGVKAMFVEVEKVNQALLSVPGPKGLFDFQFLLGSMLAITLLPYTQPQISTRLTILKNVGALHKMAVGIGIFAFLVILPTAFMGANKEVPAKLVRASRTSSSDESKEKTSAIMAKTKMLIRAIPTILRSSPFKMDRTSPPNANNCESEVEIAAATKPIMTIDPIIWD